MRQSIWNTDELAHNGKNPRRLDPKACKNTSVFCPKVKENIRARSSPSIIFLLRLSSGNCLAGEVEIHLRKPVLYLLSNKISFIHWHHLPQGTAGFCQVASLLPLAGLAFLCLLTAIATAGVKGLVKICGKNKDIQGAMQTSIAPT